MVMAENVRLALGLVARGEAPLGIVYETDAKIEPAVKVIGVFPNNTHDPIIYPVALTANAKSYAVQYLSFLRTQTAKSIFEKVRLQFPGKAGLVTRFCAGTRVAKCLLLAQNGHANEYRRGIEQESAHGVAPARLLTVMPGPLV